MSTRNGSRNESAPPAEPSDEKKEKAVIRGTVKYPWGEVRKASVTVGEISVVSDNAGNYEIASLDPDSYNVEARAPFPGYEAATQKVELAAGEIKVVDFYLDFEKATVEGHVCDVDGKPIGGAVMSGVLYGQEMQTVTSDDQGFFRFDKVTPGDRFMRVNAQGYMGQTKDFTAKKEGVTTVEFRLQPASCRIYGTATDESSKAIQAEIFLMKSGVVVQKTRSDASTGDYEFPVLPGIYEINAVASGRTPTGWHGSVTTDMKVDLSLVLAPETPPEGQNA
jgi:hypothetical protein